MEMEKKSDVEFHPSQKILAKKFTYKKFWKKIFRMEKKKHNVGKIAK